MPIRYLLAPVFAALLCSCAAPAPHPSRLPAATGGVTFDSLPGAGTEHVAEMMPGLLRDCARLALAPADQTLGGRDQTATRAGDWGPACAAARALPPHDEAASRLFLQQWFTVQPLTAASQPPASFTGYDEPELPGSREKNRRFPVPVMIRPADLADEPGADGVRQFGRLQDGQLLPYFTRAEIDAGALRRQRLDLLYLHSPIDLFFLQLQGSGRIVLPHGQVVRVGYAASNGQTAVPIGRALAERGDIAQGDLSASSIRAWLTAHPRQARATMELNPAYTFFRELPGLSDDAGPLGTLGVQLEPMRSVAVDPAQTPLGALVWIDTTAADGTPLQRLMLAQDTGSAITDAVRIDIFYGWGAAAEAMASTMAAPGRAWALVPKDHAGPP